MAKTEMKKSKSKKKNKTAPRSVAMKNKTSKAENPFETIWSRRKFDILGKKRKGEEVRIGLARSLAMQKRNKTLLKEYEQSGKSSVFIDNRIGERNNALGEFDKAIMRSQRQRQSTLKANKKSKYNLSDGEDDELEMQGLGERDDFEDDMLSDDDVEADENEGSSNVLKQLGAHNAYDPAEKELEEGEENKHKSKKEIMEEVISKSKYFKAQKAKDKEENVQLMEDLDKTFSSLVQSQGLISLTEPGKMNALKALVNKEIPKQQLKNDEKQLETLKREQPDSYDKLVKEMALDMRARPSDRTKTPEEIAQEERERLQLLEEERQKRMLAPEDSSDEENEDSEKVSIHKSKSISGDDLGDSFSLEEEQKDKRGWVDEVLARKDTTESEDEDSSEDSDEDEDEEASDGDDDAEGQTVSLKDWEHSDDDNVDTDLEEEEEENEHNELDKNQKSDDGKNMESRGNKKVKNISTEEFRINDKKSSDVKKKNQRDIPFLIEAPTSLDEFCALVENCSNSDTVEVINRIRASNAIKLAADNRKKMQVFYGVLLQYFAVSANQVPLNFELLNLLVKPLMEISVEIPYFAAICARQRILRTRTQFCEEIKNPEKGCWPSLKTLFLLRLWSMIFPCSDFRHVVMTPAILLMCEYLMRCPIKSGQDIAIGSFLCSMVLNVCRQSKKLCPEVIIFVRTLLMAAKDKQTILCEESEFYHLMEIKALSPLLCIRENVDDIGPINFLTIMSMPEDSSFFSSDDFRCSMLMTLIETLEGFVNIYEELNSFPEIFIPIATLLLQLAQQQKMPAALQEKSKNVARLIKKKADDYYTLRRPLQMQKKKLVPIKLLNPKFEENFVKGRDYDPDRERAERRKLKKLVQREAKGAARELRKDNYYLSQVKEKEKQRLEEERAEKYGRARAFLQEQEHAFKSGQLGKGKGGKRKR